MIRRCLSFFFLFFSLWGFSGIFLFAEQNDTDPELKVKSVACVIPLTGRYNTIGNELLRGVLLARDKYDYPRYKIHVIDVETSDVLTLLSSIKQKEDLLFIIGPLPVNKFKLLYDELLPLDIPIVAFPIWQDESFEGRNLIKFYYPLSFQISYLADFVATKKNIKKLAVMHPDTDTGVRLSTMFKRAVMKIGKMVEYEGSYDPMRLDLNSELLWLKTSKPDLIFLPDGPSRSSIIIKRILRERVLFNTIFLGLNTWNSRTFEREIGKNIDGVIANVVFTDFIDKESKEWYEFYLSFKKFSNDENDEPSSLEFIAYKTSGILFEILNSHQEKKDFSLINKLRTISEEKFGVRVKASFTSIEIYPEPMLFTIERAKIKRVY